jgi:DNA-directed RNA polymerase subunit K/omega
MVTKYEKARLIGARALQISMGAPFLMEFSEKDLAKFKFNTVEIAKAEYAAGVIPIDIKPTMPHEKRQDMDEMKSRSTKGSEKEE